MTGWSSAARLTGWAWLAAMAASLSLAPLVQERGFLLAGAVAGAGVALVGGVGRRLHLPVVLVLVLQLFVLLEWATFAYASELAWGGLVPTRDSMLALVDVVRGAVAVSEEFAPPAPADGDLGAAMAMVVGGVALVIDLVAVSWRRPALVGLVFLGVYMAPVSLLAGNVPVLAFAPGALAFVFLLGAEQRDRVGHWGRQIAVTGSLLSARDRQDVAASPLIRSGRRVGLGAVALAVVLPVVIPTFPRTFLAEGPLTADEAGGGDGVVQVDNPMLDLRRNLGDRSEQVLATVRTSGDAPSYLRIAALDEFTGSAWIPSPRDSDNQTALDRVAVPPGLTTSVQDRERVAYEIRLSESFETSWLPTFYPLTRAEAEGPWGVDRDELDVSTLDEDVTGAGLGYATESTLVVPSAEDLESTGPAGEGLSRYLELPDDMPSGIEERARAVTDGTQTRFDAALALQDWFRSDGGFEYSLQADPGDGMATIEAFVSTERVGYCEQFAAAMALMARELGIPSRVAVGFLRPEALGDDTYEFRGVDMHAWPELYFEGVGWVRFEPTPPARTGAAPEFEDTDGGPTDSTTAPLPTQTIPRDVPSTPGDVAAADARGGDGGIGGGVLLTLGGLLLAAVLAVTPRAARAAVRSRRWHRSGGPGGLAVAEAAWRELGDTVVDLGVRIDHTATLRTSGRGLRSLVDDRPEAVAALNRLVIDVERSRFARGSGRDSRLRDLAVRDVEVVLDRIAAGRSGVQRARARWLPGSLLPRRTGRPVRAERRAARRPGLLLRADDQPRG